MRETTRAESITTPQYIGRLLSEADGTEELARLSTDGAVSQHSMGEAPHHGEAETRGIEATVDGGRTTYDAIVIFVRMPPFDSVALSNVDLEYRPFPAPSSRSLRGWDGQLFRLLERREKSQRAVRTARTRESRRSLQTKT